MVDLIIKVVLEFLAAKAAPISRNVRSSVSQLVSKQIKKNTVRPG